ncbi:MAG: ComEC/Rec2 family competence protein [Alcaligenaceae bacterium]|nr:ComEC/Rec2 family competence protein [Alcaligenaceae bacterium]
MINDLPYTKDNKRYMPIQLMPNTNKTQDSMINTWKDRQFLLIWNTHKIPTTQNSPHVGDILQADLQIQPLSHPHQINAFDTQKWGQQKRIHGFAKILSKPTVIGHQASTFIPQLRENWRTHLTPYLKAYRYGGVMMALIIGDQKQISPDLWTIFRRAGISHLVAISGAHLMLLAGSIIWLTKKSLSLIPYQKQPLSAYMSIQRIAWIVGLICSAAYATLSGWGLPVQRAFIMMCFLIAHQWGRWQFTLFEKMCYCLFILLLYDPLSALSAGLYLSFAGVLVLSLHKHQNTPRIKHKIIHGVILQLKLSYLLLPLLTLFFQEASFISPFVNLIAGLFIGLIGTPLLLFNSVLSWIQITPIQWLVHRIFYILENLFSMTFKWADILTQTSFAFFQTGAMPITLLILLLMSSWILLHSRQYRLCLLAIATILPLFYFRGHTINKHDYIIHAIKRHQKDIYYILQRHSKTWLISMQAIKSLAPISSELNYLNIQHIDQHIILNKKTTIQLNTPQGLISIQPYFNPKQILGLQLTKSGIYKERFRIHDLRQQGDVSIFGTPYQQRFYFWSQAYQHHWNYF